MNPGLRHKIRRLVCTHGPVQNHRAVCPICCRPRHVRRTGFWPVPRPIIRRICGSRWADGPASLFYTKPDFVIIGAPKAGTTSLYDFINLHPHVVPASAKEVEYFSNPEHYALGMAWYRTHFPGTVCRYRLLKRRGFNAVSGEATQRYFANPDVPGRMRQVLPDVRLIVILRNPVERAYSDYQMRLRNQRESRSFEDAINGEKKSLSRGEEISWDPDGSFRYYTSYLRKGHYADHLANWFGHYDRSRFLILSTERMGADPQGTLDRSFEFLGLEPFEAGGLKNKNVGTYEGMNPDTRRMLVDHFRPHNERLYRLLEEEGGGGGTKRTFDWDR